MKSILTLIAAVTLVLAAQTTNASAASYHSSATQAGQISDSQLADLGLGGMQRVSETDAQQVRGKFLLRGLRINIVQNNTNKPSVTNIFLSSPLQIFTLLGR